MEPSLTLSEMNTLMDIAFLFQSVQDLQVVSQKFLQLLGKVLPYEKGAVLLYQENKRRFSPCAEIRCGGMLRDYTDRYVHLDYLGWQIFQSQERVFRESDRVRPEEREASRFYREFLRKYDVEYRLVLSGRSSAGALLGTVMLFRSRMFEDFSPQEVAILEMLHNHFSTGIENAIRLDRISARADLAQTLYRTTSDVMVILDEALVVQEGNEAAEQFLRQLEDAPQRQREFFRVIRACCRELREAGGFPENAPDTRCTELWGGSVKVSMIVHAGVGGQVLRDFVVVYSPKAPDGPAAPPPSAEDNRKGFFETLGSRYGLTRRELDLIALALEGLENKQIAELRYISLFTVKSHFQNAYAKLGVKSRQELFLLYMKYLISAQFREEFDAGRRKEEEPW